MSTIMSLSNRTDTIIRHRDFTCSKQKFVVDFYWPGFIIIFLHQLAELLCGTYLLFIHLPCREVSLLAGIGEFFLSESSTC